MHATPLISLNLLSAAAVVLELFVREHFVIPLANAGSVDTEISR